ncbi:MAG: hypothetical protein H7A32_02130 [Deltaproteobacteria bacterium]|nr:hypothetical protein [Deltaproteobacteria bacterium]
MAVATVKRSAPPGSTSDDAVKLDLETSRGSEAAESEVPAEEGGGAESAAGDDQYVSAPTREVKSSAFSLKDVPSSGKVALAGSQWEAADLKAHPKLFMALASIESYKRGEMDVQEMGVEIKALFDSADFKNPQNKAFYDEALADLYQGLVDSMKYRVRQQYPKKYKEIVAEIEKSAPKASAQSRKEHRFYSSSKMLEDKRFRGNVDVAWGYVWMKALEKVVGVDLGLLITNPAYARVGGSVDLPVRDDLVLNVSAYVGASSIEGFKSQGQNGAVTIDSMGRTDGLSGGSTFEGGIGFGITDRTSLGPRTLSGVIEGKQLVGTAENIDNHGRVFRAGVSYDRKIEIPLGGEKTFLTLQGPFGRWTVYQNFSDGGRLYPEASDPSVGGNDRRIGEIYPYFPWMGSIGVTHYMNGRPDYEEPAHYSMLQGFHQLLLIQGLETQNAAIRRPMTQVMGYQASKGTEGDIPAVRDMFGQLSILRGLGGVREGTGVATIGLQISDMIRKGNAVHLTATAAASAARMGWAAYQATRSTDNLENNTLVTKEDFDTLYLRDKGRIALFSQGLGWGIGLFDAFAVDPYLKKYPGLYAGLGAGVLLGGASLVLASAPISGGECAGNGLLRCSVGSTHGFFENAVPDVLPVYKSWVRGHMALIGGAALAVYPVVKSIPLIVETISKKKNNKNTSKSGQTPYFTFGLEPKIGGFGINAFGRF